MWPTLWPGDVINDVMNMHIHVVIISYSHNLIIPMHRKFNADIFARLLVIMKRVVISFIKEYRGPILGPPCDVIEGVIIMKNTFLAWFGTILSYLRSNWSCVWYFKIFKMAAILSSRQAFLPEVIPEVEHTRKMAISISDILRYDRSYSWNIDGDKSISKVDLLYDLVTQSMTSSICPTQRRNWHIQRIKSAHGWYFKYMFIKEKLGKFVPTSCIPSTGSKEGYVTMILHSCFECNGLVT